MQQYRREGSKLPVEGAHAPPPKGAPLKPDSMLSIYQNHLGWKWLKRNPWKSLKLIKWDDVFQSSFNIVDKGYEELSKVQILEELELSTIFSIIKTNTP